MNINIPEIPLENHDSIPPVILIQQDGRKAEIVIDTGYPLRNGKTWRAFAKVYCPNVYTAGLVTESLDRRIGDAVEAARREAYEEGYRHALLKQAHQVEFSRDL